MTRLAWSACVGNQAISGITGLNTGYKMCLEAKPDESVVEAAVTSMAKKSEDLMDYLKETNEGASSDRESL